MNKNYQKILLKLSGEALQGTQTCIDAAMLQYYANEICSIAQQGTQIAIVCGGGNIMRGAKATGISSRLRADSMGMLATMINSIALQDALIQAGAAAEVFASTSMESVAQRYNPHKALEYMHSGGIAIIGGGTGNPYFSTDTAAALRAIELQCHAFFKGTKVDGIYSADPTQNPHAQRYSCISYQVAMAKELQILDQTAFALCHQNRMPIIVFDITGGGNLRLALQGQAGSIVE
jgi:uridylate kinase